MSAIIISSEMDSVIPSAEPLPGDLAIWLFIFAELLVFGALFVTYAFARHSHVALFDAEQRLLDRRLGLLNTLLLISSSYAVARAVAAIRCDHAQACGRCLLGALLLGAVFVAVKLIEFNHDAARGMSLSRNLFDMFYLSLTCFHFLHVLMAMVILTVVSWKAFHGAYSAQDCAGVESGASFWHMVDLVWIILFVLVYVLH